ncbi:Uncharacterized protein TCM_004373 [Theobroma cacao]|uniref:Uncharacterized protein n=1 Tax=Theobroma cacao TaxID=3641 RepID=A0A061DRQ7_THECC|nr:Uncharacterized protein TCM_004373 [Theobroma cacao]
MAKTSFTSKARYGELGRATLGKKRKNTIATSLFKKMAVGRIEIMVSSRKKKKIAHLSKKMLVGRIGMKFKFERGEFPLWVTKFGSKSLWVHKVEREDILKFKHEKESCDHTNDYEFNDKSVEGRLPKHEYLSLGERVDDNAIQESLIDMIDFLPFTMQNVGGDEVNATTKVD